MSDEGVISTNIQYVELDWLTFTSKNTGPNTPFRELGERILSSEVELGEKKYPFSWMGYR